MICDFAESYHIYDMRQFPVLYIATLAKGLRHDSRIMMAVNGLKVDLNTLLLAHIADNTAINTWFKTKDAQYGNNRPPSMIKTLTRKDSEIAREFVDGDDFIEEWRRLNE
ncbi:MAG: hypothetical protein IKE94_01300 [Aeriscardovia sp.]|nr:hypothetical protein [Aeriscardovia sp.]